MRDGIRSFLVMLVLFGLAVGTVAATDVTFRVVDQFGDPIAASFVEIPAAGDVLVPNDGTVSLASGSYSVLVLPGLNGSPGGCCIQRSESITVSGASQTFQFVWKTGVLTATLLDQDTAPIPGALMEVNPHPATGFDVILPNGGSVRLPVTEDQSSPPITGVLAGGYTVISIPAINGSPIGCCLFRVEPAAVELTEAGVSASYVWHMADLQLTLLDENAAAIPGALTELKSRPSSTGASFLIAANGSTVRVPVTEDPDGLTLLGETAAGYGFLSIPAINASPIGCCLVRNEPDAVEVPAQGAAVSHVWQYADMTVELEDQDGLPIGGGLVELLSSATGNSFLIATNGSTVRVPVTEDPDGLALLGVTAPGYGFLSTPAINGSPIGCCLVRRENFTTELTTAGATQPLVWEYAKGTLHVVDSVEQDIAGSFIHQPFLGEIPTGTSVAIPVNDDTLSPVPLGTYAGGYEDISIRLSPTSSLSGPFEFEFLTGKVISPPFVNIAAASFGLRFDVQPVVDLDGDGFNAPEDCDDSNAQVHPGAPEIPGNATDENCDSTMACDPAATYRNHGAFVSCVAKAAEALFEAGLITEAEKDAIVEDAAQSDVGKN